MVFTAKVRSDGSPVWKDDRIKIDFSETLRFCGHAQKYHNTTGCFVCGEHAFLENGQTTISGLFIEGENSN